MKYLQKRSIIISDNSEYVTIFVTVDHLKESVRMNFIGDYFAFGLVIVLCMFFFDGKHTLNKTSKYFVAFLMLTAATSAIDVITGSLMDRPQTPYWINMAVNSLYFLVNILTTSCIALYLFNKILEHSHDKHCMTYAMRGLTVCFAVFVVLVIANIWTGWMFYFDESNAYCRGPLNAAGYFITVIQMGLVVVCYVRNRKNANSSMRRVLLQTFPVVALCIVIQRMYPEIMLNSFIMSMVATVLFLTFNGQRPGVHALTRLNDRHRFFECLEKYIQSGRNFQVFTINIKNFGVINQKYGHMFGDELLYQFAFSLEKLIKNSEAFHMNGTVFALVLPCGGEENAKNHREEILKFLESGIVCGSDMVMLDYVAVDYVSSTERIGAEQLYEMLEYAAAKAYKNKQHYIRYTPDLSVEMRRRRYLVERMQVADYEHGFRVWFQPIQCVSKRQFCTMEALVRIIEPDGSIISPAEFIPVAEQTGMVASITWFVLEESCRILKEHPELENTSVAINLFMAQMLEKDFRKRVNAIVDRYGIAHNRIGLEFTERAILENFAQIQSVMEQFTKDGYRFYLDDFGAGYSNFNCLLQLPFSNIKLDMNLIHMDIASNGAQRLGLVKTLSDFLHGQDMVVIAEGVETTDEAQVLTDMGVDRIQGYVFARPMPEEDLLAFYRENPA